MKLSHLGSIFVDYPYSEQYFLCLAIYNLQRRLNWTLGRCMIRYRQFDLGGKGELEGKSDVVRVLSIMKPVSVRLAR